MFNEKLTCWFCGNNTYYVVLAEEDETRAKMIRCTKCSEPLFLSATVHVKQ